MSKREKYVFDVDPVTSPFKFSFWVPGTPRPKHRARAGASAGGKAFMRDDPRNKMAETYIRECCEDALVDSPYRKHFPLNNKGAIVVGRVYALYPPPAHWFPGMPYLRKPDRDNIDKLPWDALSGKSSGRPPLIMQDDQIVIDGRCVKAFWDPRPGMWGPGYPKEPGTLVVIHVFPVPRDPSLAPAGMFICPGCGRDDFKNESGWKAHSKRCKVDSV